MRGGPRLSYNTYVDPLLPILLGAMVVVALGANARTRRIDRLQATLEAPLAEVPPELAARWRPDPVLGGAVAVTALDAIYNLSQIDPGVLDAIDAAHGTRAFESYPELVGHVQEVAGRGDLAFTGMVSQYKGYVGELTVADHLRAQGHHVELSDTPNEAGVDALVDGQPVQIKSGLDSSAVTEHLEHYPDVPVITVAEHGEVFADAEMVTVLPDVSGAALEATTREALGGMDELAEVGFDMPLITIAISGASNVVQVWRGNRDVATALEFTGADTVGVGGGGFAGAQAGGVMGAAVGGPVGAALGAVAGAVAGSVAGRKLAKVWKERGLREARGQFNAVLAEVPDAMGEALSAKARELAKCSRDAEPRGLRGWLWPDAGWLVRREVSRRYAGWAARCSKFRVRVAHEAAEASNQGGEALAALGGTLLQRGSEEPVFSARLQALGSRAKDAAERVQQELRRLGYLTT